MITTESIYFAMVPGVLTQPVPRLPCLENVILLCEMTVCGWFPRSSPRLQSQFKRFCHSDLCFVHPIRFPSNIPIRGITFFPRSSASTVRVTAVSSPSPHDYPLSPRSSLSLFFFSFVRVALTPVVSRDADKYKSGEKRTTTKNISPWTSDCSLFLLQPLPFFSVLLHFPRETLDLVNN